MTQRHILHVIEIHTNDNDDILKIRMRMMRNDDDDDDDDDLHMMKKDDER